MADNKVVTNAKFVTGSTMRHVVVMTLTSAVGLMAIFFVDFANLYYISLLGKTELAAAIGYAGTLLFFTISYCIGIAIAAGALVSRALGEEDRQKARRLAASCLMYMGLSTIAFVVLIYPFLEYFLALFGAKGETKAIALSFLQVVVPTMPLMGIGMCASTILRAAGDARRAMYVTLSAGVISAVFDPLFIFTFDLGVMGAAYVTVLARLGIFGFGLYGAIYVHKLVEVPSFVSLFNDLKPINKIAIPAIATNIATPVGNGYVTAAIADFGDDAVAGWAIIGRLLPVGFGVIYSLSGAVGPIIGQNVGASRFDRVRQTMRDALLFTALYTVLVWLIFYLFQDMIIQAFGATGESANLLVLFCSVIAGSFVFNGCMFVANAAFNNLGVPTYSTAFNWGKATLGTIPFVWVGAQWGGAGGVLIGQAIGTVLFGIGAVWLCLRVIERVRRENTPPSPPSIQRPMQPPFSSGKAGV